jgi:hypothetical protein
LPYQCSQSATSRPAREWPWKIRPGPPRNQTSTARATTRARQKFARLMASPAIAGPTHFSSPAAGAASAPDGDMPWITANRPAAASERITVTIPPSSRV